MEKYKTFFNTLICIDVSFFSFYNMRKKGKERMKQYENYNIEFKQSFVDSIKKEVVAFGNSDGGKILIGVDDNGKTIGVKDPDDVMLRVSSCLRDNIVPDIMPFVKISAIEIDNKDIIEIVVNAGTNKPYYLKDKGLKPSGVYVRKGSGMQQLSEDGIKEMIISSSGRSYEICRSIIQDLSFDETKKEFKKRGVEFKINNLNFVGEDGLYTNLAYLLSDQCSVTIKLAIFQGIDKEVFRDRKEYSGSLLKQLDEVYNSLDLLNKTKASFDGLDRIDVYDYPKEAIREALLNMIVHRDYSIEGSNIINVYEDRIEFVSVGGLISSIELESIFLGASRTRNPKLADVFYRLRLIESYGTGVSKILRSYAKYDVGPKFETAKGVFRVTLPNVNETSSNQLYVCSPPLKYDCSSIVKEKEQILDYVHKNGSISRKDTEKLIGSGTTKAYRLLKELCEDNKLRQEGSGKLSVYR